MISDEDFNKIMLQFAFGKRTKWSAIAAYLVAGCIFLLGFIVALLIF